MDIACTFFGHHDCPSTIKPKITDVLIDLIENHAVEWFYVGNTGTYDRLVRSALRELAKEYPHIHYAVVLDRLPVKKMMIIWRIILTLFCRKALKTARPAMRSSVETGGCYSRPIML